MQWNSLVFRNIFQWKAKCWGRLLGVQTALSSRPRASLYKLETKLVSELNSILNQEESYWRQKARMKWICQGEWNTRFFHALVLDKRRRNRILQLKLPDGTWCCDETQLQQLAYEFYHQLYSRELPGSRDPQSWSFPTLPRGSLRWLNRELSDYEIHRAVF